VDPVFAMARDDPGLRFLHGILPLFYHELNPCEYLEFHKRCVDR